MYFVYLMIWFGADSAQLSSAQLRVQSTTFSYRELAVGSRQLGGGRD